LSLLTRVFVLLVAVLSIVLVAMIVPFVVNTQNYQAQLATRTTERDAAELLARTRQSELTQATQTFNEQLAQATTRALAAESQLSGVLQQLRATQEDVGKARANIDQLTAANRQHAASSEQQAELIRQLTTELGSRREEVTRLATQYIQATDRIAELEEQNRSLTRANRGMQERLTTLETTIQGIESRGGVAATTETGTEGTQPGADRGFEAETPIQGRVSRVETVDGETLVQIDVGQNDGVQENMRFIIARGDQYIGTLVVSMVDERSSAGRMRLEQAPVQQGDTVISGRQ
jgi:hypothetical protein